MRYRSTSANHFRTLSAVWCLFAGSASAADAVTPATVIADINARGAYEVVKDIFEKPEWGELLDHIETGQRQWLEVAVKLYAGTDAGSTEMLTSAVGVALLHQPRQVLLKVAPVLGMELICSSPDIDDPRWSTQEKTVANLDARIASVSNLRGADVTSARDSCLKYLREARAILLSPNGPYS
jgi:hypothetical protein